ncbi:MAG: hypothetical protein J7K23_03330 [Thermoproteales archaeon]|nr:hypothetical protein [Thermoproteales archaeon]
MGRITNSFRIKLDEAVIRIDRELIDNLINKERKYAFSKVVKAWFEEANALQSFSQPYIYGSLTLLSIIDLQAKINRLEERIKRLERMFDGRLDNRPTDTKQ